MKYKILNNGKAVIITRQPVIGTSLNIEFIGAPSNATVVFVNNEKTYYKKLINNVCTIDLRKISGIIKVTIADFEKDTAVQKWIGEELSVEKVNETVSIVSPNDMNLPMQVTELYLENENIRKRLADVEEKYKELLKKFDELFEGYDLI